MRTLTVTMWLLGCTVAGCGRGGDSPAVVSSAAPTPVVVTTPAVATPLDVTEVSHRDFRAPVVDGFSDPSRIVYDDAYLQAYERRDRGFICGIGSYEVVGPKYSIQFQDGLDETRLGERFRIEDLIQFLETRQKNPNFEQVFPLRDPARLKKIRAEERGWDPWTGDLCIAMSLVGGAMYRPAIPVLAALARSDPDSHIRLGAIAALGQFARAYPEALQVLQEIVPRRRKEATLGLEMAKHKDTPWMLLAKPSDQPYAKHRPLRDWVEVSSSIPSTPHETARPISTTNDDRRDRDGRGIVGGNSFMVAPEMLIVVLFIAASVSTLTGWGVAKLSKREWLGWVVGIGVFLWFMAQPIGGD